MYSGSEEFNKLIEQAGGNAVKPVFVFDNFNIESFKSLKYYGGSNGGDNIDIGTANSAYLEVTAYTDKVIANQEFLFKAGMELSGGTIEYAPMGYFTVSKITGTENGVTFTAVDRMAKLEKPYISALTYPSDSAKVLDEICSMCGVTLNKGITTPITISEALTGHTCREVLGYIAAIQGKFAYFDRNGLLNLGWYENTHEIKTGLIWSISKAQDDVTVGKVTLAKDAETTYTSGTGVFGIENSNPYATQAITDSLYNSLKAFKYRPCEISMLDNILIDPTDMLKMTYIDGSVYIIPAMVITHDFSAGETKIKAVAKSEQDSEYSFSGPITQAIDRTYAELLTVNRIVATKVDAEWVKANTVTADKIEAVNAEIDDIKANMLTVETADIKYANVTLGNIDTANIDKANIGILFNEVGLIDRATIVDGHITGFLDAVEINADSITAGTLIADRILLKGSENGLLYQLNNLGELTSANVDTLDGTILTQRTVTADKLVAKSITANELDVDNIFGNSAVLSTLTSQQAFINAISTNSVVVGASNTANNALNTVNNLEIGGRNLLKNSANMTFLLYGGATATTENNVSVSEWDATDAKRIHGTGGTSIIVGRWNIITPSIDGFPYTNSIYIKNNHSTNNIIIANNLGGQAIVSAGTAERVIISGVGNGLNYLQFQLRTETAGDEFDVTYWHPKAEIGNKATDWTPAPEDISVENIYTPNTTTIDGGKITTDSIKAAQIDVNNLFAQHITATGTITGAKLYGTYIESNNGKIGGWDLYIRYLQCSGIGNATNILGYLQVPSETTDYVYSILEKRSDGTYPNFYVLADGTVYAKKYTHIDTESIVSEGQIQAKGTIFTDENVQVKKLIYSGNQVQAVGDIIAGVGTSNQVSLQTLNSNLGYPDYAGYSELKAINDSSSHTDESVTISNNGFVFLKLANGSTATSMFWRLKINNFSVSEGYTITKNYNYGTTAAYPVKKGDVVKLSCSNQTSARLYFFPLRKA